MARRGNQYEAAFEQYLRSRGVPYMAVSQARRSLLPEGVSIKNLDYLVSAPDGITWLVDIKGRQFPSGRKHRQYWKNWSTRDDLKGLARWEELLGEGFYGLLVFAFLIVGDYAPVVQEQLFEHGDRLYAFVGVRLDDYAAHARVISPKWDTLALRTSDFRRLARPLDELLGVALARESCLEKSSRCRPPCRNEQ